MKHTFSLGALPFGSVVDDRTSIALLDRYVPGRRGEFDRATGRGDRPADLDLPAEIRTRLDQA